MDFLFVVRNWVRAKAAGKLENKQTVGEGWGGGGERQKEYCHFSSSWTLKYTVHIPCFFFPYRQDQTLTVTGSHFVIGFKCTEGGGGGPRDL